MHLLGRRLEAAPPTFLLAHDPVELARQARLVEPLPRRGDVRVAVSPDPEPDRWRIDVACRDRGGILARLTWAIADADLDIVAASVVTWPDGGVLDSFVVCQRAAAEPSRRWRSAWSRRSAAGRRRRVPIDVEVTFDDDAAPWYTVCVTRGPDRSGLLASIASAFDDAKVDVHAARLTIAVDDGVVDSRFEVTDRYGRKLDAGRQGGRPPSTRRRRLTAHRAASDPDITGTNTTKKKQCRDCRETPTLHDAPGPTHS